MYTKDLASAKTKLLFLFFFFFLWFIFQYQMLMLKPISLRNSDKKNIKITEAWGFFKIEKQKTLNVEWLFGHGRCYWAADLVMVLWWQRGVSCPLILWGAIDLQISIISCLLMFNLSSQLYLQKKHSSTRLFGWE